MAQPAHRIPSALSALALTAGLLVAGGASTAHAATGVPGKPATWGSTKAPNQVLKRGCAPYRYRYTVTAPTDEWAAEIFLVGPRGKGIASAAFDAGANRARNKAVFRLCAPSLRLGRYTIRMKITWQDGYDQSAGFVRNSTFRLTRR